MTAPADLQPELDRLLATRSEYRYTGEDIRDKVLTGLIAPTAVGKSTVIMEILRRCQEMQINADEVGSITTRQRRQDGSDPRSYRTGSEGITHASMIHRIQQGELINWSLSATGDLYATDAASYPAEYNFLPLLPDSLPMLKKAGFRALIAVYITAPANEWGERLKARQNDPKFAGRLTEAISSLQFAKENKEALYIINNPTTLMDGEARPSQVAQNIIDITLGNVSPPSDPVAVQNIDDMLEYAFKLRGDYHGIA